MSTDDAKNRALIALRQPDRMLNTGKILPVWRVVPLNLRNDILIELMRTGCARDFRIVYELKLVADARVLHYQMRKRELVCMTLHSRVGRGTQLGRIDGVVMQMVIAFAGLNL